MSILIRGMEMPKGCLECRFCATVYDPKSELGRKNVCVYSYQKIDLKEKRDDCPLIELPPHGRLIDADELCNRFLTAWDTADKEKKTLISAVFADIVTPIVAGTPTIIESEGEDGNIMQ